MNELRSTIRMASAPVSQYPARYWDGALNTTVREVIAEEVPVALVYNGLAHAVMLATPLNLEEFALGFTLSEGIVPHAADIHHVDLTTLKAGVSLQIHIAPAFGDALHSRRRMLTGRTGCGLCGTERLEDAVRPLPPVGAGAYITPDALEQAFGALADGQHLHHLTGAIHAAAWADADGTVKLVREDVGRHNALDKLIGTLAAQRTPLNAGFVLLTSRASSEMVQKAATVGITTLAAVSAPTGLAIRLAQEAGVTLVGFVRDARHTVYAHPQRILAPV